MTTDLRIKLPPANYAVEQIIKGRAHLYRATLDDGKVIDGPGVTGILGIISKPALVPWATRVALENAERALLSQLGGKKSKSIRLTEEWVKIVIAEAKKVPEKAKDDAADLGTLAHGWFEAFIRGEAGEPIESIKPAVEAFRKWVSESGINIVQGDTKVFSLKNGYGGALDAIGCTDDGEFVLLDWKTSNGCYPEYALQVAAYCNAFHETYGIDIKRAVIVRFSKVAPVEFEAKELSNLGLSLKSFLDAKALKEDMAQKHFLEA